MTTLPTKHRNQPLTASVIDGELVIRIGVNTLAHAASCGNDFHEYKDGAYVRNFAITNPEQFARDVVRELEREEEDGSSPLSGLLDEVIQAAVDDGSEAVEYDQSIKFEEKSPLETWNLA